MFIFSFLSVREKSGGSCKNDLKQIFNMFNKSFLKVLLLSLVCLDIIVFIM